MFGDRDLSWNDCQGDAVWQPMLGRTIGAYSHLMQRADAKRVEELFDRPAVSTAPATPAPLAALLTAAPVSGAVDALDIEPLAPEISIDDFTKIDLRIARIVNCEASIVTEKRSSDLRPNCDQRDSPDTCKQHVS